MAALAGGVLTGCAADEPAAAPAPQGVSASVLQYRSDYPLRRIQMKVVNDGGTALVVTAARLRSPRFAADAVWDDGPETIPPHARTDLPAILTASRCESADAAAPTVTVDYRLADGGTASLTVDATDPFRALEKVNAEDCLRQSAMAIADLRIVGPLRTTRRGDRLVGLLDLQVTPTGAPGELALRSIAPTTLLQPDAGVRWRLGSTVSAAGGPQTVTLPIRPARCDLHAIGEDKIGTVLPVTVAVGGRTGVLNVVSDIRTRGQIYAFVAAACR